MDRLEIDGKKIAILVASVIALFALLSCVAIIPAGHVGVVTTFGSVSPNVLDEGFHVVAPWQTVERLTLRTLEDKETASVPTKEGLSVQMDASILYSLERDRAAEVFRTLGPQYEKVIVQPTFRSIMRSATAHFEAKDLYTANREQIESALTDAMREQLSRYGVHVNQILLRDVQLPHMVRERIEAKLAADQDAQRMAFVLQKETQEAERKRVEAKGIADAQTIIKKELDDNYIRYMWVMALKEHQGSVIYVPTGTDGLPFFRQVHAGGK